MHLRLFNFVVLPPSFCCFKIITTAFIVSETMLTGYLPNISFPHVDRTFSAQASRVGGFSSLQGTNPPRPGHTLDDFKLHLDIMMISLNSCVAWTPEYSNFTANILSFFQLLVFFFLKDWSFILQKVGKPQRYVSLYKLVPEVTIPGFVLSFLVKLRQRPKALKWLLGFFFIDNVLQNLAMVTWWEKSVEHDHSTWVAELWSCLDSTLEQRLPWNHCFFLDLSRHEFSHSVSNPSTSLPCYYLPSCYSMYSVPMRGKWVMSLCTRSVLTKVTLICSAFGMSLYMQIWTGKTVGFTDCTFSEQ